MKFSGKKFRTIGLLSISVLPLITPPAQAGFEFLPSSQQAAPQQPAVQQQAAPTPITPVEELTPMPVLPATPVTAQPLPPLQQPRPATSTSGALVIDPYPLQSSGTVATHGGNNIYVEQAMLQAGGTLKGIAAPGANYTSQITNNAQNIALTQAPAVYQQEAVTAPIGNTGMTPLPGEGLPRIDAVPLYPAPAPIIPAQKPRPPVAPQHNMASSGFSEAVGFGRDLPLALALSQVVPPDYSFSFAQNVDAGSTVSWEGGKSWDQVLQEMLAPVGMRAVISGNQVIIQSAA